MGTWRPKPRASSGRRRSSYNGREALLEIPRRHSSMLVRDKSNGTTRRYARGEKTCSRQRGWGDKGGKRTRRVKQAENGKNKERRGENRIEKRVERVKNRIE